MGFRRVGWLVGGGCRCPVPGQVQLGRQTQAGGGHQGFRGWRFHPHQAEATLEQQRFQLPQVGHGEQPIASCKHQLLAEPFPPWRQGSEGIAHLRHQAAGGAGGGGEAQPVGLAGGGGQQQLGGHGWKPVGGRARYPSIRTALATGLLPGRGCSALAICRR